VLIPMQYSPLKFLLDISTYQNCMPASNMSSRPAEGSSTHQQYTSAVHIGVCLRNVALPLLSTNQPPDSRLEDCDAQLWRHQTDSDGLRRTQPWRRTQTDSGGLSRGGGLRRTQAPLEQYIGKWAGTATSTGHSRLRCRTDLPCGPINGDICLSGKNCPLIGLIRLHASGTQQTMACML
jgi:hypothetical protein